MDWIISLLDCWTNIETVSRANVRPCFDDSVHLPGRGARFCERVIELATSQLPADYAPEPEAPALSFDSWCAPYSLLREAILRSLVEILSCAWLIL